jgi:ATP-dependent RNA helicase HelY
LLARSFAQYQSDREVVRLEQRLVRERERIEDLRAEAAALPDEPETGEGDDTPDAIADAVARLRPGDVVLDDDGDRLAVLGVSWRRGGRARVRLVSVGGHDLRWDLADLDRAPHTVGHIDLPEPFTPERMSFRADVASRLRRTNGGRSGGKRGNARRQRRNRHRGDDPRARLRRAETEIAALERRARREEGSLPNRFAAICGVLRDRDHLDGWEVTASGRLVGRIYHELDLLVADALVAGVLDGLGPAELASVASAFTYEHRRPTPPPAPWFPSPTAADRFSELERVAKGLRRVERHHGVPESREPDAGFAALAHAWAAGEDLAVLLEADDELGAGDFVRNVKQLLDLLRQLATVAPDAATRATARAAADSVHRGVVAASGAVEVA